MIVEVLVNNFGGQPLPQYGKIGDAGMDLRASTEVTIGSKSTALIPTGLKMEIPEGYVGLVHPRSGLSLKTPLRVANAPGTIDSGYRGEVCVIMDNLSEQDYVVHAGDRIAQLVLQKFETIQWTEVADVSESERGTGGFGSTGNN